MDFFKKLLGSGEKPREWHQVSLIDIDALLAPVTPDSPSGEVDLEYDPAFLKLEEKSKGTPEVEIGGKILQEAKGPNWHEIQEDAVELLSRTHDIRVAVYLIRALLNLEGVIGLGAGLTLLQKLVERFWDTFYPQLSPEDNHDPTQRINVLMTLCDREAVINPLFGAALCTSPTLGRCSLRDIQMATGKLATPNKSDKPAPAPPAIEAAFKDCDVNELQTRRGAAGQSLLHLSSMENFIKDKVGAALAPNFDDLRHVLKEIHEVLDRQIPKQASFSPSAPRKKTEPQLSKFRDKPSLAPKPASQGEKPMDTISNREDVTHLLDQICLYYEKNEPASPVPLLLRRAARLVNKNFFEIIQDVAPESVVQIQERIGGPKETRS